MIKETSLDFLSKLKKNNSKDWFEQNRYFYDHYKTDPYLAQVSQLVPIIQISF